MVAKESVRPAPPKCGVLSWLLSPTVWLSRVPWDLRVQVLAP